MSSSYSDPHSRPGPDKTGYTDRSPPPAVPDDFDEPPGRKLGSLAQKARGKQLNQARWILIIIGVLTVALNAVVMATARDSVKAEIKRELANQRVVVDPVQLREFEDQHVRILMAANGVGVVLGVIFIICGIMVYRFPVPATLISLVLYIVANLGFAALNPQNFAQGIIMKIIIVVALVKAVQAAFAYEKEARFEREEALEAG